MKKTYYTVLSFIFCLMITPALAENPIETESETDYLREANAKEIDLDEKSDDDTDGDLKRESITKEFNADNQTTLEKRKHPKRKKEKKVSHGNLRPGQDSDEDIPLELDKN